MVVKAPHLNGHYRGNHRTGSINTINYQIIYQTAHPFENKGVSGFYIFDISVKIF